MGGDLDQWIASIRKCELLPERDLKHLCEFVQELLLEESTVQAVSSPVTICGDIHGQFHDLLELFRNGGECPHTSYIFMVRRPPRCAVLHTAARGGKAYPTPPTHSALPAPSIGHGRATARSVPVRASVRRATSSIGGITASRR